MDIRNTKRKVRRLRIRHKIMGDLKRPRLCIFKSNQHLYVAAIDDQSGKTLASVSDLKLKNKTPKERAEWVGEILAKKCLAKKIKTAVFDRSGYKYTGLIKIIADAARGKGLKF